MDELELLHKELENLNKEYRRFCKKIWDRFYEKKCRKLQKKINVLQYQEILKRQHEWETSDIEDIGDLL